MTLLLRVCFAYLALVCGPISSYAAGGSLGTFPTAGPMLAAVWFQARQQGDVQPDFAIRVAA